MLCLSKLAKASVTLDSLRCSTELLGSASTESRFVTVSIWYSLDSFNSSLKLSVMNRKPFRKKDINKSWLVAKTDGDFLRAPQEKKESPGPISNEAKVPLTPYSFSLKKKARRERVG